ncbi:trihelix transcription factor ASR3-like [Andrographis paniculata]|uniref:trihelix transcription factor ASR3-like n=1 Tax=Andrographis paniculata TaxID=175694 RepID=UPI0021E89ADE|nr:trihelix transcription factor ASR3-like [Andrographis paniculata]
MVPRVYNKRDDAERSINGRTNDRDKARHPRWSRQETLVLIEGKRVAEEKGKRGRRSSYVSGSNQVEPKWDYVSSYCRRHGVNRGPVQCRKRWSNLVSDFKKIKTWDSQVGGEGEGFWMMRSESRRERKLPGFFDKEVFDVLDGKAGEKDSYQLVLVTSEDQNIGDDVEDMEAEDGDDEETDCLNPSFENTAGEETGQNLGKEKAWRNGIPSPVPISEMRIPTFHQMDSDQEEKRQPSPQYWRGSEFQNGAKRSRPSSSNFQNIDMNEQMIRALERNNTLLDQHLEHEKLNREQQKEQHDNLVASLNKITEILGKIADKL